MKSIDAVSLSMVFLHTMYFGGDLTTASSVSEEYDWMPRENMARYVMNFV